MDEKIRIIQNADKTRSMIFDRCKFIGVVNSEDLQEFTKDEQLNLIDFINHKRC